MNEDHGNWARAISCRVTAMLVRDLILIGEALGVDVAERIYYALAEEPRDARGERIDWTAICAVILSRRSMS